MIYIFCPNDVVTGGTDALHQILYYLNENGCEAKLVYYAFSKKHVYTIPDEYRRYVSNFITERDFVDDIKNVVILPEHAVDKLKFIVKSKTYIWWLSVDNNLNRSSFFWKVFYFATLPARVVKNWNYYKKRFGEAMVKTLQKQKYNFRVEPQNVVHLCASYYAYEFVSKRSSKKVFLCIEPISKLFLDYYANHKNESNCLNRSDEILYNPKKSGSFVRKLAKIAPDLRFVPLSGLTQQQLIECYMTSKLYVDFGPFPGAERIPKEAVLFGCCVITGRNGASNYYRDVPILDEYKFENYETDSHLIIEKIRDVLKNYELRKADFEIYRNTVLNLENKFIVALKECLQ